MTSFHARQNSRRSQVSRGRYPTGKHPGAKRGIFLADARMKVNLAQRGRNAVTVLLVIGIILLVLWLLGLVGGRILGGLIHIALIIGVILVIVWMLRVLFKLC